MKDDTKKLEYKLSDDGTCFIVAGIGEYAGDELEIPAKHKGLPVMEIGDMAFKYCVNLTRLWISSAKHFQWKP